MLPKKLLIATGNKGKLIEFKSLFQKYNLNYNLISTTPFLLEEPEEDGQNFAENSTIKAKYYARKTNITSLADDSGLVIDLLDGDPGIFSARWAIDAKGKKNFFFAFNKIKQELILKKINLEKQKIKAHFICHISLFNPKTNKLQSCEGKIFGELDFSKENSTGGFGYDPIFIPNGFTQSFAEMSIQKKDEISHRALAFKGCLQFLK